MFGAIIFLPFYFQAVRGMSPTASGLAMLPTVLGLLVTSIVSGRLITMTGHYKFIRSGCVVLIMALLLFLALEWTRPSGELHSSRWPLRRLGCTMQTTSPPSRHRGISRSRFTTKSTMFFRQMGGTIGAAVFGAIFSNRLAVHLTKRFGAAAALAASSGELKTNNIQAVRRSRTDQAYVLDGVHDSLDDVFLFGVPSSPWRSWSPSSWRRCRCAPAPGDLLVKGLRPRR